MNQHFDREEGIQAIIDLQALAGIDEPREVAEKNWDAFTDEEKMQTMLDASLI